MPGKQVVFIYPPQEHQSRLHHYRLQGHLVPVAVRHWDRRRLGRVVVERTCFSFRKKWAENGKRCDGYVWGRKRELFIAGCPKGKSLIINNGCVWRYWKETYIKENKRKRKTKKCVHEKRKDKQRR